MLVRTLFMGVEDHWESITRLVMLILVLLIALTAVACITLDDPDDQDDIPEGKLWQSISAAALFVSFSFLVPQLFTLIRKMHRAEYLDSHIGEKRFADGMLVFSRLRFSRVTALFAVPSLFYSLNAGDS